MTTKTEKKKPIHEEKAGAIRAAIWENDGREGVFYTFTLERLYKAADGWKSADSFSHRDAANISAVAATASSWIAGRVAEQARAVPPEPSSSHRAAA